MWYYFDDYNEEYIFFDSKETARRGFQTMCDEWGVDFTESKFLQYCGPIEGALTVWTKEDMDDGAFKPPR